MDRRWHRATKLGDRPAVKALLAEGADPDGRDRFGQTGLMLAAFAGHKGVVAELIARGANLDVTAKYGLSALMLAVVAGHAEVARLLAHAGAERSTRGQGAPGFAGKTAADLARERGMKLLAAVLAPPLDAARPGE
jgi:uncharacterized protein